MVHVAELIDVMGKLFSGRLLEERRKGLSDERFRRDAEEPARRHVRVVYRPVQIGDEVRVGREIEHLAEPGAFFIERIAAGGKRLALYPQLFLGEAELLDGGEQVLALAFSGRGVGDVRSRQPVRRADSCVAHLVRGVSQIVRGRLWPRVDHSPPAMSSEWTLPSSIRAMQLRGRGGSGTADVFGRRLPLLSNESGPGSQRRIGFQEISNELIRESARKWVRESTTSGAQ